LEISEVTPPLTTLIFVLLICSSHYTEFIVILQVTNSTSCKREDVMTYRNQMRGREGKEEEEA